MTSLYNIMTSYTIEQLEKQLSKRQPSHLLTITKDLTLFVTNPINIYIFKIAYFKKRNILREPKSTN